MALNIGANLRAGRGGQESTALRARPGSAAG